jgi:hypothetical protein
VTPETLKNEIPELRIFWWQSAHPACHLLKEVMTGAGMMAQNIQPAVCLSSPIIAVILLRL